MLLNHLDSTWQHHFVSKIQICGYVTCWFQGTKKEWVVEIPNLLPKTPKDLTPGHLLDGLRGNHVQKVIALKKKVISSLS